MAVAWLVAACALLQSSATGKHADIFGEEEAVKRAVKDADAAGERFREIFGVAPVKVAVILQKDGKPLPDTKADQACYKNGAKFIFRWEKKPGYDEMTHELGHLWLLVWIDGLPKAPPREPRYGSTLPDWADEGVATLFDDEAMRARYRVDMRKYLSGKVPSLDELFDSVHPESRQPGAEERRAKDRWLFYCQTNSVMEYVLEKHGAESLRHVIATLKKGKGMAPALGAKGLPKTVEELEKAWREWASAEQ